MPFSEWKRPTETEDSEPLPNSVKVEAQCRFGLQRLGFPSTLEAQYCCISKKIARCCAKRSAIQQDMGRMHRGLGGRGGMAAKILAEAGAEVLLLEAGPE